MEHTPEMQRALEKQLSEAGLEAMGVSVYIASNIAIVRLQDGGWFVLRAELDWDNYPELHFCTNLAPNAELYAMERAGIIDKDTYDQELRLMQQREDEAAKERRLRQYRALQREFGEGAQ